MKGGDPCPSCGDADMVGLVDPHEEIWGLNPDDFDEDAEVWHCMCGWHEQATEDESMNEALANIEFIMERLK